MVLHQYQNQWIPFSTYSHLLGTLLESGIICLFLHILNIQIYMKYELCHLVVLCQENERYVENAIHGFWYWCEKILSIEDSLN